MLGLLLIRIVGTALAIEGIDDGRLLGWLWFNVGRKLGIIVGPVGAKEGALLGLGLETSSYIPHEGCDEGRHEGVVIIVG